MSHEISRNESMSYIYIMSYYILCHFCEIFEIYVIFIYSVIMKHNVSDAIEAKARINENGRIVIPAEIRQKMGLEPGDTLFLSIEGPTLRIESQQARIRRIQESLSRLIPPDRVLSDELIGERREEAHQEMEEWLG